MEESLYNLIQENSNDFGNDDLANSSEQENSNVSKQRRLTQSERKLKRANEELMRELESYRNMAMYEKKQRLESDEKNLKLINHNVNWAKMAAEEEKDNQAKVEAEDYLTDIKIKLNEIQKEKAQLENTGYANQSYAPPAQSLPEEYNDFLDRNPYLDFRNPNNPNFSPTAFKEAQEKSARLSMQYKMEGRGEEDLGEEYFKELEKILRNEAQVESNNNERKPFSSPVSGGRFSGDSSTNKLPKEALDAMNGWLKHAISKEHAQMIRDEYKKAHANNFHSPNLFF